MAQRQILFWTRVMLSYKESAPAGNNQLNAQQPPVKREKQLDVVRAHAHHCLKPKIAEGGGVDNICPFAVEYSYCVYRPTKDSWSESFECGKSGGSWQVGARQTSIMHTSGEKVYWFACKYGESLSKPDGISPKDVTFAGDRLVGRCAEW
jgi:hypothetical protein